MNLYQDRRHAGRLLAEALGRYKDRPDVTVLALPRGGVPVAFEVARRLGVPLDVFVVRKLGVPGRAELAMGAIASGGVRVLNPHVVDGLGISRISIDEVVESEQEELARREGAYRRGRPPLDVRGRIAILIDDGLATGSTMRAAVAGLRQWAPARILVAVPVAAPEACQELGEEADEIVCLATPHSFRAVGLWYVDFGQTTDAEVREFLDAALEQNRDRAGGPADWPGGRATG